MTEPAVEMVTLDSGRRVAVHRVAEGNTGRTLILCHAAPGSGAFDPDSEQTLARGVTLLAVDRPGYGQSDPVPQGEWATVSSAADDLAVVIDRMVGGPVGVAGWSAGGRVALALAARRPDLVDRVVMIGTPAPNEHVPWIPPEEQEGLDMLRSLPVDEVHSVFGQQLASLIPEDAGSDDALALLAASPADEEALARPGAREQLARMLEVAFAQGATGMASDVAGYCLQPWGFEPQEVKAKTLLLYGAKDPVTGNRHASWWQKHLPDARVEMNPQAGHLLVLSMWSRALSHLAAGIKRQS